MKPSERLYAIFERVEKTGEVSLSEVSGSETLLYVKLNIGEVVLQLEGIHDYYIGQKVTVSLAPDRLFLFNLDGTLCAAPGN